MDFGHVNEKIRVLTDSLWSLTDNLSVLTEFKDANRQFKESDSLRTDSLVTV